MMFHVKRGFDGVRDLHYFRNQQGRLYHQRIQGR